MMFIDGRMIHFLDNMTLSNVLAGAMSATYVSSTTIDKTKAGHKDISFLSLTNFSHDFRCSYGLTE